MKRWVAMIIMACFLCQLTACKTNEDISQKDDKTEQKVEVEEKEEENKTEDSVVADGDSAQKNENSTSTPTPTPTPAPKPMPQPVPTPTPPSNIDFGTTEEVEIEEIEEVEVPEIKTEIEIDSSHKPLAVSSYYQFTGLNSGEKNVYKAISDGAKNGETYVDLSSLNCSKATLSKVYSAVTADNPQYFYLTNRYAFQCQRGSEKVEKLILLYLDGTSADDLTDKVVIRADRTKIASQIEAFNKKVESIIKKIPTNVSEIEKEKMIYDYLQDTITYDFASAELVNQQTAIACHAFDVYGAACEGKAVCEGYAELFQYLCYCVGINATQVYGTANGGSHMWNTVCIDSEWYMLDVTWDDQGTEGLHYYTYFDLTTNEMSAYNHMIDASSVRVPECSSLKHAFYKDFALYAESLSKAPTNYKAVIDYVVKNKEKSIEVYIGKFLGDPEKQQKYLSEQIFATQCDVQKYIKSKGYTVAFDSQYYMSGNYCYIIIK